MEIIVKTISLNEAASTSKLLGLHLSKSQIGHGEENSYRNSGTAVDPRQENWQD